MKAATRMIPIVQNRGLAGQHDAIEIDVAVHPLSLRNHRIDLRRCRGTGDRLSVKRHHDIVSRQPGQQETEEC